MPSLAELRSAYHASLCDRLWGVRGRAGAGASVRINKIDFPVFNNADAENHVSVAYSAGVAERVGVPHVLRTSAGSTSGSHFEQCTGEFLAAALKLFLHLQPAELRVTPPETHLASGRRIPGRKISAYAQFEHLSAVQSMVSGHPQLEAALGGNYLVAPDILVVFEPMSDEDLDRGGASVATADAQLSPFRAENQRSGGLRDPVPILHASVSCKWTMRRDRAQNTRHEALNLVRNRKGRLPHITAVTMECDPDILGSLSLGTGDIDCVYHGALPELLETASSLADRFGGRWPATAARLLRMTEGSRLRDISDLPLDLLT